MNAKTLLFLFAILISVGTKSQSINYFTLEINKNVKNTDSPYFQPIVDLWHDFLNDFDDDNLNNYWIYWEQKDESYLYRQMRYELYQHWNSGADVLIKVLGIAPKDSIYYQLKTAVILSKNGEQNLLNVMSVYAQRNELNNFRLVSSTSYFQHKWQKTSTNNINFYLHPFFNYSENEAFKMDFFNNEIARYFNTEVLNVNYFACNNTDEVTELMGYDFYPFSLDASQTGGLADTKNQIIYAGNGALYYPHELIHLYTSKLHQDSLHWLMDEGLAAYLGGSSGYKIEWHWQKLKHFLNQNPNYDLSNINKYREDIPNGEHITQFIYPIGALICRYIDLNIGKDVLKNQALSTGRSNTDLLQFLSYHHIIKSWENLNDFIREQIMQLPSLNKEQMELLAY